MSGAHRPLEHGTWDCDTCPEGTPWPCEPRRAKFSADYVGMPHELRSVLALFMYSAAETLNVSAGDLHARFVGWSIRR